MRLEEYKKRGKDNKEGSIKTEKFISSLLKGSIVCQHIDIVWKKMTLEVRSSSQKVGNCFQFRIHKTEALYYIFVGDKYNEKYFWVMPTQLKFLKKRRQSIRLPLLPNQRNAYFYKYRCKASEIGERLKNLNLNKKRWKIPNS